MSNTIIVAVAVVLYFAYQRFSTRNIKKISGSDLKTQLSSGHKGIQLIDVRTPEEYRANHVKGFTNVPLDQLMKRQGELDPAKPTIVMCASGSRSTRACKLLTKAGYTDITNLQGGISAYPQR